MGSRKRRAGRLLGVCGGLALTLGCVLSTPSTLAPGAAPIAALRAADPADQGAPASRGASGDRTDAGGPAGAGAPAVEQEPTRAELDAQARETKRLRAQARSQAGDVRDAEQDTRAAARLAGQALEDYTVSLHALRSAQDEEERRDAALTTATRAAGQARARVTRWARQAYEGGSGLNASPMLNTLLGTNGAAPAGGGLDVTLRTMRRIGENRSADLRAGRDAQDRAERAAADAAIATRTANRAAVAADRARTAADAAVTRQRRILDDAQAALDSTSRQADQAQKEERRLRAALQARRTRETGGNQVTGQTGTCAGADDIARYPNGNIPLAALCPLASAPGHYLRADAAHAFDRLSAAYAEHFGTPICVTDSYRDRATQVRLYATKPGLAARPGTSNHGWGTATDLCGGVQNFGTPEHEWLFANAPVFGWFHPAWAQPDGSRPEAWHWEFGG
ncbi:M15 family metallopeptidase [Kineosporia sp. J2-2]|uniref:M15 family metallopeptidase n=1 Tax=Kineosporia corallincola TaxID=2835133 RepID=A0ABS5TNK9_9ACTN|nr:M15 family metallopeptidase [Kineosporia corallincola]MBT0771974.1 M15 family metallopeptidase [Kineosporia corallincola]